MKPVRARAHGESFCGVLNRRRPAAGRTAEDYEPLGARDHGAPEKSLAKD